LFRRFANFLLRILFNILLKVKKIGAGNVPAQGPFIAMINHIYFLDPILTGALAPRFIVMMSKIENYNNPLFALILNLYGSFPIRRGELDLRAIRTSLHVLREGQGLLVAPEGTRSLTRTLQQGRDGMALIALRTDAAIVPVAINGQEQFMHNLKRLRRTPVRMVFGEPFYFRPRKDVPHREQLRRMTSEAMYRLAALLPPEYRGVYSDLENATSQFIAPYEPRQG